MKFINLCLSIPNLDTIIFYIIFVILIPGYLFVAADYETLKYYLPALIMLAVTLTEGGAPDLFVNLYPNQCINTSVSGFLSTNIINGLAIVGILVQSLVITLATSNLTLGFVSGLITFAIAFPLAQQILPYFINQVDEARYLLFNNNVLFPNNWHKYMAGLIFSIVLLGAQYLMIGTFTMYILSSNTEII